MTNAIAPNTAGALLRRILDAPDAIRGLTRLSPASFTRLVHEVGLEDAGELLAFATSAQLERLLDDELWKNTRPGEAERFDPVRFGLWLEVLLEGGPTRTTERLAELSDELLALALQGSLLVFDRVRLERALGSEEEGELLEKALDAFQDLELGDHHVFARRPDGFDAIQSALLLLEADDPDRLDRILGRAAIATNDRVEEDGLFTVLEEAESLHDDVAEARERRRSKEGFVPPLAAAAFLRHAKESTAEAIRGEGEDPITREHFAALDPTSQPAPVDAAAPTSIPLLLEEGDLAPAEPATRADPLREALADLAARSPELHARRVDELAYLANVILAGAEKDGRPYRPAEAAELALEVVREGLARSGDLPNPLMIESAVKIFRLGWSLRENSGRYAR